MAGPRNPAARPLRIAVLEGDEAGQELLDQALRVLAPDVPGVAVGLEHFDLSLEHRRATDNACTKPPGAMRACGLPGVAPLAGVHSPISVVRMAVEYPPTVRSNGAR